VGQITKESIEALNELLRWWRVPFSEEQRINQIAKSMIGAEYELECELDTATHEPYGLVNLRITPTDETESLAGGVLVCLYERQVHGCAAPDDGIVESFLIEPGHYEADLPTWVASFILPRHGSYRFAITDRNPLEDLSSMKVFQPYAVAEALVLPN
jgi:hypothetical protein